MVQVIGNENLHFKNEYEGKIIGGERGAEYAAEKTVKKKNFISTVLQQEDLIHPQSCTSTALGIF